ncbi:hypothetical protein ABT247_21160 [Kitasatospora sp. NPDC001539]|uniref:hypothetical protein n=1 Tax=Kitasatospora sp. NPDC001539 TaxID=3154384 RepID=UPI003320C006
MILLLSLPLNAWLHGLTSEAGKDTWQWIKRGVEKLYKMRAPRHEDTSIEFPENQIDGVVIKDTKTGIEISIRPNLPNEAWKQLATIQLPPTPPGVADTLAWEERKGRWQMGIKLCGLPLERRPYVASSQKAQIAWDPNARTWRLERIAR